MALSVSQLQLRANVIRQDIIEMLVKAQSGHSAGALGMADIFTALYSGELRVRPEQPKWPSRDRMVVSNGHICAVWYATLANVGFFSTAELATFRKIESRLQGHPSRLDTPGVENSSGPLGQGLSVAVGMATAARLDQKEYRVYCAMSDGEHDEGQTWEAVLYAGQHPTGNLLAIVDRNRIQIDGYTEDISPLGSLADKYRAFQWHVIEIDGHHFPAILAAFDEAKQVQDRPVVIIANTIPGKGVSFMENKPEWHGKPPSSEQATQALQELREQAKTL